jgi:hypothetical protein
VSAVWYEIHLAGATVRGSRLLLSPSMGLATATATARTAEAAREKKKRMVVVVVEEKKNRVDKIKRPWVV